MFLNLERADFDRKKIEIKIINHDFFFFFNFIDVSSSLTERT